MPVSLQPVLVVLQPRRYCSCNVAETSVGQSVLIEVDDGQASDLKERSVVEFEERILRA